jgi:hypothetical protein
MIYHASDNSGRFRRLAIILMFWLAVACGVGAWITMKFLSLCSGIEAASVASKEKDASR